MPASSAASEVASVHACASLAAREALPIGSRLSEFRILRVLGSGGFGIVYLAHDDSLQRQVAVKEYLPGIWARRGADGQVSVHSSSFCEIFAAGLTSFVNEARLLARFDHPSLVKVHRFWQANGTAYMVMPYYEGVSLTQVRASMSVAPDEAWLRRLLDGVLGALQVMHDASVFHRDVAPDNILVLPSGAPVLLDFGAARHVLLGQTQVITAILKPSYAPIEQYAGVPEVRQGPWTDIYATAATLHYCLTGKAPSTSAARAVADTQPPLHRRADIGATISGPAYDKQWLEALDWGLEVMPQRRPQSIAQWKQALAGRLPVPSAISSMRPTNPAPLPGTSDETLPTTELAARMRLPETVAGGAAQFQATLRGPGENFGEDKGQSAAGTSAAQGDHVTVAQTAEAGVGHSAPRLETIFLRPAALRGRIMAWPWVTSGVAAAALASGLLSLRAIDPTPNAVDASLPAATVIVASSRAADPAPRPVEPAAPPNVIARDPVPASATKARAVAAGYRRAGRAAPAAVKALPPSSPQQLCNQPAWLSRLNCMRITCATLKWEKHPHCANWPVLAHNAEKSKSLRW